MGLVDQSQLCRAFTLWVWSTNRSCGGLSHYGFGRPIAAVEGFHSPGGSKHCIRRHGRAHRSARAVCNYRLFSRRIIIVLSSESSILHQIHLQNPHIASHSPVCTHSPPSSQKSVAQDSAPAATRLQSFRPPVSAHDGSLVGSVTISSPIPSAFSSHPPSCRLCISLMMSLAGIIKHWLRRSDNTVARPSYVPSIPSYQHAKSFKNL